MAKAGKSNRQLSEKNDSFVGYGTLPNRDRRFLIAAVPTLIGGLGFASAIISRGQAKPAESVWGQGTQQFTGRLVREPYPYLLVPNRGGGYETAFLVQLGKHGANELIKNLRSERVTISGKLLSRRDTRYNYMIEAVDARDEIGNLANLGEPRRELGNYKLTGRILDSKCHFGVMRPSLGITHKACASLCVRGGIPPIFVPQKTELGRMIITKVAGDGSDPTALLPYMLDLIEVSGQLASINNHYEFTIDPHTVEVIASC